MGLHWPRRCRMGDCVVATQHTRGWIWDNNEEKASWKPHRRSLPSRHSQVALQLSFVKHHLPEHADEAETPARPLLNTAALPLSINVRTAG